MVELGGRRAVSACLTVCGLLLASSASHSDGIIDETADRVETILNAPDTIVDALDALDLQLNDVAADLERLKDESKAWKEALAEAETRSIEINGTMAKVKTTLKQRLRVRRALKLDSVELRQLIFARGTVNDRLRQRGYIRALLRHEVALVQRLNDMALNAQDVAEQQRQALTALQTSARELAHRRDDLEKQRGIQFELLRRLRKNQRLASFVGRHRDGWKTLIANDADELRPPPGGLAWPIRGQLVQRYGMNRYGQTQLTLPSSGWIVAGRNGQSIRATLPGHVLYAGRYRSLGHVVIIEHSDRIRSVYVYHGTTLARGGQKVRGGQKIGQLTAQVDQDSAKLYFELRVDGRPRNPGKWLRKRP